MVYKRITHAAIQVPDMIEAENFYTALFDTGVEFRETTINGVWHTLASHLDWKTAEEAGYQPKMSFIRKDEFFLALELDNTESAEPTGKYHLGLEMNEKELQSFIERAEETSCSIIGKTPTGTLIEDIYGYEWDVNTTWRPRSTGESTGNWIDL